MQKKEVIVILGGGLIKENSKWRTVNFNEGDTFGAMGDRLRVLAGNFLYKDNPDLLIVASGGKGQYKDAPGARAVSEVIKDELIELGIPRDNIVAETNSGNTFQQLQEFKKNVIKEGWQSVVVISNQYHLPRIRAMIETDNDFKKMLSQRAIKLQSAEEICLKYEPKKWKEIIKSAYRSEAMKGRIKLEKKGVQDIKKGVYKFK